MQSDSTTRIPLQLETTRAVRYGDIKKSTRIADVLADYSKPYCTYGFILVAEVIKGRLMTEVQ